MKSTKNKVAIKSNQKRKEYLENIKKDTNYSFAEAIEILKKASAKKFDETVDLIFNLKIDPTKSDENISSFCNLPNNLDIKRKIVIITNENLDKLKKLKPYKLGDQTVVDEIIKQNDFKFDYLICSPNMMKFLGKYGKQLGTKGLFPSIKKGLISENLTNLYNELKNNRIILKNDKKGVVHTVLGKLFNDQKELEANYQFILKHIINKKNPKIKGNYIKSIYLSSTMGPALKLINK